MTLKISISGIRGTVPDSLTPEVCLDFAKAFGSFLGGGKIVIGIDPRASSESIKGVIFAGLLSAGCKVIDLGICPTPTVGIMVRELRADGGIMVTASHNPLPWNGIKFLRSDGIFLNQQQAESLIRIYEDRQFKALPGGTVIKNSAAIDLHISKVLAVVNPALIRKKKFRVAVDACNGAGSSALLRLLEKLGCRVLPLNVDTSLPFPHPPEPVVENLGGLIRLVKSKKADLGMAVDSDADRLALVSELGKAVGEEMTLAMAVNFILDRTNDQKKKIVVVNLSTTRAIDDLCRKAGALSIRTKVGEVNVAEELKDLKGLIGGEGNGGVIFPPVGFNRDSLTAAALILNYLAESGKTISELVSAVPGYVMIKTKVECKNLKDADKYLQKAKRAYKGCDLVLTEGIKAVLPEGWVHVRASNTEPIVRIIAEAKDRRTAEGLIRRINA